jgi:hypothetical protein
VEGWDTRIGPANQATTGGKPWRGELTPEDPRAMLLLLLNTGAGVVDEARWTAAEVAALRDQVLSKGGTWYSGTTSTVPRIE